MIALERMRPSLVMSLKSTLDGAGLTEVHETPRLYMHEITVLDTDKAGNAFVDAVLLRMLQHPRTSSIELQMHPFLRTLPLTYSVPTNWTESGEYDNNY